ncbi:phosphate acyltransferase PlsX [Mycoplasmoides pirum]|uniref:phosphate acyltransferase PlsX n=1 Tax=Mycoplasmoides pirum TaxID=2122 RepID=UPI0004810D2F|nr:phosphate acyltransferase PlsX [Mycoplasmoides pirum]
MKKFTIALDCMGFENNPKEAILAAIKFNKLNPNINFLLFGPKNIIFPYIKNNSNLICIDTSEVVEMDDTPITARRKINSSMYQAIQSVVENKADAVLSAGSSGAYTALCYSMLNKISSTIKPGFMSWLPTIDKKGFYFLDVGANKEFTGKELYNLGLLANQFIVSCKNIKNPRIGLLNIGTESFKGFEYHHEANKLFLNNKNLNYIGYLEPRNLINGVCDVLVADGYSGNLVLKSLEGAFKAMGGILKNSYKINPISALFSFNVIYKITSTFNYKNNAGALILGLNKVAMKTHGSADLKQFFSSLRMTKEILESDLINKLKAMEGLM